MSTVYIVTNPMRRNQFRQLQAQFDFSSAEQYGRLVFLLGPGANPLDRSHGIVNELHAKLRDITVEDYLLLVGSPILIGAATTVAAKYTGGRLQLLQWHGYDQRYTPVAIDLNPAER